MPPKPAESDETRLREILLGHLQNGSAARWPGVDGLTTEAVLEGYPEAVARGEVPDWQELLRRHPELNHALSAWLAAAGNSPPATARGREPSAGACHRGETTEHAAGVVCEMLGATLPAGGSALPPPAEVAPAPGPKP